MEQELVEPHALDEACPSEELQVDGSCADAMGASSGSSSGSIANARSCAEEERAEKSTQGRRRKRWSAAATCKCISASASVGLDARALVFFFFVFFLLLLFHWQFLKTFFRQISAPGSGALCADLKLLA